MRRITENELKEIIKVNGTLENRNEYFDKINEIMNSGKQVSAAGGYQGYGVAKKKIIFEDNTKINIEVSKGKIKTIWVYNDDDNEREYFRFTSKKVVIEYYKFTEDGDIEKEETKEVR